MVAVNGVHVVFDSDLNRTTLPGGKCEREHSMRANVRLDSPQMHMPLTLCREFALYGEKNGERIEILHVSDNRKRSYYVTVGERFDALVLIPMDSWGDKNEIPIVSFDFE